MSLIPPRKQLLSVERVPHAGNSRQGFIPFDRNERTEDFPPEVMAKLREKITPFLFRAYPEPAPLYRKLSEWLGQPKENILLTLGADGGLRSVFETFVNPGDEVVYVHPSYAMYPVYCSLSGAVPKQVSIGEDLSLPLEKILGTISGRAKLVVLANPNQPVERLYSDEEIRALLETCRKNEALLLMDEAYHHFCPHTASPFIRTHENLVVARTFSKAFGLAGLRLGYLLSHPENIRHLDKVRPMYEASSVAIAVALYMLENDHLMKSYVSEVRESLSVARNRLQRLGLNAWGQWSNSVLVRLPEEWQAREAAEELKTHGFLVRAENQPPLSNHLRVTLGGKNQTRKFLELFENLLAERKGARTLS